MRRAGDRAGTRCRPTREEAERAAKAALTERDAALAEKEAALARIAEIEAKHSGR